MTPPEAPTLKDPKFNYRYFGKNCGWADDNGSVVASETGSEKCIANVEVSLNLETDGSHGFYYENRIEVFYDSDQISSDFKQSNPAGPTSFFEHRTDFHFEPLDDEDASRILFSWPENDSQNDSQPMINSENENEQS